MEQSSSFPQFLENEIGQKLSRLKQEHLLKLFHSLRDEEKSQLLNQTASLDEKLFFLQREHLLHSSPRDYSLEPFDTYTLSGSESRKKEGRAWIGQGKCACLIVAGGQGSRLRFEGPKGCFPVSLIKKKSLFQLVSEKIKAAGHQAGSPLECAIMTSPHNHVETKRFFHQHGFFGLTPDQVHFFCQDVWPLLNFKGDLFLDTPFHFAVGPNGNGGAFHSLVKSGIHHLWKKKGIEMVNFILIDNVLADPFDVELFGFHASHGNEVSIKATFRTHSDENVGVIVKNKGKVSVIEYSEFPQEHKIARSEKGFRYPLANLSLFCFSMPFIERISKCMLPFHSAKKAVRQLNESGQIVFPELPNAWKFEEFIFDVLPFSEKVKAIVYPRQDCFAPLKNFKGIDSIETVQAALQMVDRKIYFDVSGVEPPSSVAFELSQDFYYPTEALIEKWKGRPLPEQSYIEA